ncbi:MAG TPA: carbonic anhydrase [Candidatus Cybelea sp.]|jgi:carbonic anhydrase
MTSRPSPAEAVGYGFRVAEFAGDPYPFAVILGCSDARLSIETIFDQVPGNLFIVRVAGNFVNGDNLGSIELAVDILKASLVLVLGHSRCGAILAALAYLRDGTTPRGHISEVVEKLLPSVRAANGFAGDLVENAIAQNVADNVKAVVEESEIIADAVGSGDVVVADAIYNVGTGRGTFA